MSAEIALQDSADAAGLADLKQRAAILLTRGDLEETRSLIDTAMAFACVTCMSESEKSTTIDLTVHYLRPHIEGEVFCTAKVVRAGKRILTVSVKRGANVDRSGNRCV